MLGARKVYNYVYAARPRGERERTLCDQGPVVYWYAQRWLCRAGPPSLQLLSRQLKYPVVIVVAEPGRFSGRCVRSPREAVHYVGATNHSSLVATRVAVTGDSGLAGVPRASAARRCSPGRFCYCL